MDKKQKTFAYHGLVTGYDKKVGDKLSIAINKIDGIATNPDWEICTSDCPIGEFGVVVSGELVYAHHDDCFSCFDSFGKRIDGNGKLSNERLSYFSQAALNMYAAKAEADRKNGKTAVYPYCEFWHTNCQVVKLWVSRKGQPNTLAIVKELAEWYGLPVMVVDENVSQLDKLVGI